MGGWVGNGQVETNLSTILKGRPLVFFVCKHKVYFHVEEPRMTNFGDSSESETLDSDEEVRHCIYVYKSEIKISFRVLFIPVDGSSFTSVILATM